MINYQGSRLSKVTQLLYNVHVLYVSAKLLQSCPTVCHPMDCSPLGSSVHGILQAIILEWVPMPSSRGSSRSKDRTSVSYVSCIGRWVLTRSATWEASTIQSSQVLNTGLLTLNHKFFSSVAPGTTHF